MGNTGYLLCTTAHDVAVMVIFLFRRWCSWTPATIVTGTCCGRLGFRVHGVVMFRSIHIRLPAGHWAAGGLRAWGQLRPRPRLHGFAGSGCEVPLVGGSPRWRVR